MKWLIAGIIGLGVLFPAVADARKIRKIRWAQTTWKVRHTYGASSPGRNIFSDSKRSAFVDRKRRLVLRIYKGRAVEVYGPPKDYGMFSWSVDSNLNNLDLWRVVGLFVWVPNGNEQDIEFARWGVPHTPTGWVVSWARHQRIGFTNFAISNYIPYRVFLTWTPAFTRYRVIDARGTTLVDVSYSQLFPITPSRQAFQPRMSNWLWPGVRGVRLSKRHRHGPHPVLRLKSFHFTPLG
jgi:hypothetical protein